MSESSPPVERPPAGTNPHLLVADVGAPALDDDGWHHLLRVRRHRVGDAVTVTDGRGRWRRAEISAEDALAATGDIVTVPAPDPALTIAFALTKGDKPELVVQKLTELGVDRIVPFRASRSVVKWDDAKAMVHHRRWVTIAQRALEQARRVWMPEISLPVSVEDLVTMGAVRVDRGGIPLRASHSVFAVGPEGGWDAAERELLPTAVSLGPHVLRAETAALTIGALSNALRSGVVGEFGQLPHHF